MFRLSLLMPALIVIGLSLNALVVLADGGTSIVATPGQSVHVLPGWPAGVGAIVNDPVRGKGWNSWFSEWPNDVNQYALNVKSTKDLNRLINKLATVDSKLRQIRLSYLKEPDSLGWVTRLPPGNRIPVIFSIGDQSRIDEWYRQVRKPFGVMNFIKTPEAVPPTLTIFVQHPIIRLDELQIPGGISVTSGYVPTVFHRFNTTIERDRQKKSTQDHEQQKQREIESKLDSDAAAANAQINAYLEKWSTDRDD